MALLPRVLRPSWIIRRWALYQGVRSDSALLRFLAMFLIGRTAFLRRTSTRQGVYGGSRGWRAVAGLFFLNDMLKKFTVKEVQYLSKETLTAGQTVVVTSIPPKGRRAKRAS